MGAGPEAAVERSREQGDDPFSLVKEECNQDILYSERCAIFWNETLVCLEI
ncbi:rCG59575 [Rattus norvegicus]|uniref:RCG59575 n=1 Tax=Rattus norvegicus TaxID=10116 RepID=A6HT22_RAT|nr:rCG59575 [Rattus norvegicus]